MNNAPQMATPGPTVSGKVGQKDDLNSSLERKQDYGLYHPEDV